MSDGIPGDMIEEPSGTNSIEAPCYTLDDIISAFSAGYDLGHNDTVDGMFGDGEELALDFIKEMQNGC